MAYLTRIRECRIREGLSQSQLARLANLSVRTIVRAEEGKKEISELTMSRLVGAFDDNPRKRDQNFHLFR